MADTAPATLLDRTLARRPGQLADGLAVAVAVSLPWSTTASGILIALWLVALLPTLSVQELRRGLSTPAGGLPAALCLVAFGGMLWADAAVAERFGAVKVFLRLLCVALLLVQFQNSSNGHRVLGGFLLSCIVLLAVSWLHWLLPLPFFRRTVPGVPVKDYIVQSGEFIICAYALAIMAVDRWRQHRCAWALALAALAALFLVNIAYVATARSTLIILGVFVLMFGFQRFGWKGIFGLVLVTAILAATAWSSSTYLRGRVLDVFKEIHEYQTAGAVTSSGVRLELWRKSIAIFSEAPVIGHGTGSLREQFQRAATDQNDISSLVTDNPHNQTIAIALQLGLVGVLLLYAMWISHLLLFRGSGLLAMVGASMVVHNIIAGIFNTYLFEFTFGWIYVFGVGVIGGMVMRDARPHAAGEDERAPTPKVGTIQVRAQRVRYPLKLLTARNQFCYRSGGKRCHDLRNG
jgi:O-antigen ligase